jgi:hypothetical protein
VLGPGAIQNLAVKVLCADDTKAFSGKVDAGFPQKMQSKHFSMLGRVGRRQVCQGRNASSRKVVFRSSDNMMRN